MIYASSLPALTPVIYSGSPTSGINDIIYGITVKEVISGINYKNSIISCGYNPNIIGSRVYATIFGTLTTSFSRNVCSHLVGLNNEVVINKHIIARAEFQERLLFQQLSPISIYSFPTGSTIFFIHSIFVDQVQYFFWNPIYNQDGYIESIEFQNDLYGDFEIIYVYEVAR